VFPLRRAGRVVVLDPDGRVLLFRYDDSPPNGRHWSTPGGGLDPGESFAAGAARELTEETGWTDVAVGAQVFTQTIAMDYGGRMVSQEEVFFLARVPVPSRPVADVDGMHAADGIDAWRWWTVTELSATEEVIWPAGLAALILSISSLRSDANYCNCIVIASNLHLAWPL
jgi:ADP-ribose pyrophosphatase YjhB (NUDIX family)